MFSTAWTLKLRVQIPLRAWMHFRVSSVLVLPCVGTGIETDCSHVQRVLPNIYKQDSETQDTGAPVPHWLQEGIYIKFRPNPFVSFRHMDAIIPWLNFVFSGQRMHTTTAERWNHRIFVCHEVTREWDTDECMRCCRTAVDNWCTQVRVLRHVVTRAG
jgi:hypothetical protein